MLYIKLFVQVEGEVPDLDKGLPSVFQKELLRGDGVWRLPHKGKRNGQGVYKRRGVKGSNVNVLWAWRHDG